MRHLGLTRSPRTTSALIAVALSAIGVIVYVSPIGRHDRVPDTMIRTIRQTMPRTPGTPAHRPRRPKPTPKHVMVTSVHASRPPTRVDVVRVVRNGTVFMFNRAVPEGTQPTCADFAWQQDAQAYYLADLSDPAGIDSGPGPGNGDGLACTMLPSDPSRPRSTPEDAFSWPPVTAPAKAAVVHPAGAYFGVAADGLPGSGPLFDAVDREVGKAPGLVEWFQTLGDRYPFAKVAAAWQRHAVPVITWMTAPQDVGAGSNLSAYSLHNIAAGAFDGTLRAWAASVAVQRLPVVIRLDHEMNGTWYPWAAGYDAHGIHNTPADYVAAWRHIWAVFNQAGANEYAVWAYTPTRVDSLRVDEARSTGTVATSVQADYPGDGYVDWIGLSAYQYQPSEPSTFEATFAETLQQLRALSGKPIFIAETGSTQSIAGTDRTTTKVRWTVATLAAIAADPRIVGLTWFDNDVSGRHTVDGVAQHTDWRFDSSAAALTAFRVGIADNRFIGGAMPPYLRGD